jgi:hypothetical protein
MIDRSEALTRVFSMVNDRTQIADDIIEVPCLHVELDHAVAAPYGWRDLDLDHGFHETAQGVRYTIGPAARTEVLDHLLELNHERHGAEVATAGSAKTKKTARKAKPSSAAGTDAESTLFGSLFADDPSGDDT